MVTQVGRYVFVGGQSRTPWHIAQTVCVARSVTDSGIISSLVSYTTNSRNLLLEKRRQRAVQRRRDATALT